MDSDQVAGMLKASPGSPASHTQNLVRLAWGVIIASHGPDSSGGMGCTTFK